MEARRLSSASKPPPWSSPSQVEASGDEAGVPGHGGARCSRFDVRFPAGLLGTGVLR